ncbi:protein SPT2 homolog [Odontesthes bonariensis]|uniref:protein SPT2 homolog n=1 Tax=Odontesthes bonariensis TaxID=219752 RepID=UPI003F58BFD9
MMDFDNILDIASQNQGVSSVQRRYSLQTGPPKKDPRSKGVNPAAVQALLKKQHVECKKKELQMKKKKDKLLAKRVELKSDRKARAMASRTKDNFKGYNGVPVVDVPKKRGSKLDGQQNSYGDEEFRNNSNDPLDDEDNYEYEQTDSEPEQELETMRPGRTAGVGGSGKSVSKKPSGPPKPGPSPLNFADLLKLAEKKQFEPVDLKPKAAKKEDRLRTADEIRELEMERKAKKLDKNRDPRTERERDGKSHSSSSSIRKSSQEKEQKHYRPQKNSSEKPSLPSGSGKKSQPTLTSDRGLSSSKSSVSERERERLKVSQSDRERSKTSLSSKSGAINGKVPSKATSSQVAAKQVGPRPSSNHKSNASSDLSFRKDSLSLLQKGTSGIPGNRPSSTAGSGQKSQHGSSQQTRPSQSSSLKQGPTVGGMRSSKGEPLRPGSNSAVKSSGNSVTRPSLGGPPKAGNQSQGRLGGTSQTRPGSVPQARPGGSGPQGHPGRGGSRPPGAMQGRPGGGGLVPGRPTGSLGSGPGRPTCTVVSETISSKNFGGPRPGGPPRPGMPQRPGMGPRPGMPPRPIMNRPPGMMLPPITSAYKRKYEDEDEEYDSEMDDFIDDGGEQQDEISRHIKEIFGYDRTKYKDESDYALKFMESSWKDVQKEETRSLKLAVQEDLEEEKREEEDLRRQKTKRKKMN